MPSTRTLAAAVAVAAVLVPAQAAAHAPGVTFSAFGTPTVDGEIGSHEWADAASIGFAAATPGGGSVPGELLVMNDESNLYLAVRLGTASTTTSVAFSFDNDHDGLWPEEGTDGVALGFGVRNFFGDLVLSARGGCPAGSLCGFHDVDLGGTVDGMGARGFHSGETHFELSHVLDSPDDLNDFSVGAGDVLGFGAQTFVCTASFDCARTIPVPFSPMGDIVIAREPTAEEQLADLAAAVEGAGAGKSLSAKVEGARSALARGDLRAACGKLAAFVHEVDAHAGKGIAADDADALVAAATRIAELLEC